MIFLSLKVVFFISVKLIFIVAWSIGSAGDFLGKSAANRGIVTQDDQISERPKYSPLT